MNTLRIAVVGPGNSEIEGPIFREAAAQAQKFLGQKIVAVPLRLGVRVHAILLETGVVPPTGSAGIVTGQLPALQGLNSAQKLPLVKDALIAVAQRSMLNGL